MLGLDRSSRRLRALTEHGPDAAVSSQAPALSQYRLLDAVVVLAVLAVSLVQLVSHVFVDDDGEATNPDALGVGLVLLTSLPLLWRRRHPWAVMAIAGGGGIALVACGYSVHVPAALFVALYTFAASGRGAAWPPIAFAGLIFVAQVAVEIGVLSLSLEDYLVPALLLAGSWIVGERRRTAALRRAEAHERREREERLSIAEERTRIARELHDSAGHAINTILVQAGAARVLRERDPERSREAIEAIERLARETIEEIDRIVGSLRAGAPAERAPLPGIEQIPDLVADLRQAGLEVELRELADDWRKPPPAVDRAAYRVAQEALTNAARHGSGRVELTLHQHVDRLELIVVNPIAATPVPARPGGGGLGLVGMRERAQLLGGFLESGPVDGRFRVRAVFPYSWVRE